MTYEYICIINPNIRLNGTLISLLNPRIIKRIIGANPY